jgi:cytochrome P450
VRFAPLSAVTSVSDVGAAKAIYSGKFLKSYDRYSGKNIDGNRQCIVPFLKIVKLTVPCSMLTLIHRDEAKARRSMLLPLFQTSNLEEFEHHLARVTKSMLEQMQREQNAVGSAE